MGEIWMKNSPAGRRCWGITATWRRCARSGNWLLFCPDHRWQWTGWLSFLVFTVFAGSLGIWSDLFPNVPADKYSGVLLPDNLPTPPYPCQTNNIRNNAVKVFLGKNVLGFQSKFPVTILRVRGEDLLSVKRDEKEFLISAKVFSQDGNIIAGIEDNEFFINKNNSFRLEISDDKHSLVVRDQRARKVLNFYYINPSAIKITGIFSLPNSNPVIIDDEKGLKGGGSVFTGCIGELGEGHFNF
jgi:hypothetical protein